MRVAAKGGRDGIIMEVHVSSLACLVVCLMMDDRAVALVTCVKDQHHQRPAGIRMESEYKGQNGSYRKQECLLGFKLLYC